MKHDKIERNVGLLLVLTMLAISVGGLVEIVPLFFIKETVEKVEGVRPYSPLELRGRDIYIREGAIRHLTDKVKVSPTAEKLLTPQWAIDKAREIGAESVRQIKASGVRIVGSLDGFDSAEIPVGVNTPTSQISVETAAHALLAFDNRTLRRQSTQTIFNEARRRIKKKSRNLLKKL